MKLQDTPTTNQTNPTSTSSPLPPTKIIDTDQLTTAFVKLNACHSQLEIAKGKHGECDQLLTDCELNNNNNNNNKKKYIFINVYILIIRIFISFLLLIIIISQ